MPGFLKNLLNGGKLLEGARKIIDEIVTTKEEKALLEIRLQELIQAHEQALINAEVDDRKSARQREVDSLKNGSKNLTQNILAYAAIVAFFAITGYIISHGLGNMNTEESFIIGNLTGMAGAIAKDIYGYYFGSSKGESDAKFKVTSKE
jgi:hypothetical protein